MKKVLASLITLFIFGFLFVWFVQSKVLSKNIDSFKLYFTKQIQNAKVSSSLETWVGQYSFSEHFPPNINMFYSISIYKENNNYFAEIDVNGFQTMKRLLAKVSEDTNSIKLEFLKYLPDNMYESYKKGDVSFKKNGSNLITTWGEIQPILPENKKPGEYFQFDSSNSNSK